MRWSWQCWLIWFYTVILALLQQASKTDGNPYLAAFLVMGFMYYLLLKPPKEPPHD